MELSKNLGCLLAKNGFVCVNGGGGSGCMGALNSGCREYNGEIFGVIHESFVIDGSADPFITNLIIAKGSDLYQRKFLLLSNSDCVIILPGGVGTYDEIWDSVCQRSLKMNNMHEKPICMLNYDGFYDGLIHQMQRASSDGLLYGNIEDYFHVENTAEAALEWCANSVQGLRDLRAHSLEEVDNSYSTEVDS